MSDQFAWVPDVARGEWLRQMEAAPFGSIASIVPPGFESYARIFHPAGRDRPTGTKTWHGFDGRTLWDGASDAESVLDTERTSWANAAESFGTTMHSQAQFARLVRSASEGAHQVVAADGWRYNEPSEGSLDADTLAAVARILARHTDTQDHGIAAIWDGWGGLVSSAGFVSFGFSPAYGMPARYRDETGGQGMGPSLGERLAASARLGIARLRSVVGARPGVAHHHPKPGTGLLTEEVAAGSRFELHAATGRRYVLFEAGATDFSDAELWPDSAPWVGNTVRPQSPSILWPDDHSWVLATEIDFDSTLVGGTAALIDELVSDPSLEVLPIDVEADLSCEGDGLNCID
ncbi:hypothetical protein EH165_01820 [Nakamurella antarctica]|uniref:Uncharacterized protein n=1 Tax=Nakamurella antarctica TaxID=1902245 RepID=A0A3G8ZIT0_9ACTN|nr:hypothetical protein [Nakamurella antarctica]AZI57088.1 hypothetical protein EH165_01820 [Nakamurella antarctica]